MEGLSTQELLTRLANGELPMGEDTTLDLDQLAEQLRELSTQVEAYRANLVRHITARCGLLGKGAENLGLEGKNIRQLLEIKEELDEEFRQRFQLTPEIPGESALLPAKALRFKCGE